MRPFKTSVYEPDLLKEGVYDPNIFKAVFLAGGPGSGKSYVTSKVIGGLGLRIVNSDRFFTRLLKKSELSLKMPDSEEHERNQKLVKAKELTAAQTKILMKGRLGMVIDGTGGNYKIIEDQVEELRKVGYDCYMIFVNTSLEVALQRNENRDRILPEKIVRDSHRAVTQNLGGFQGLFGGSNFLIVDNNEHVEEEKAQKRFNMLVKQGIGKFIRRPLKNKRGLSWIRKNKILKKGK